MKNINLSKMKNWKEKCIKNKNATKTNKTPKNCMKI